MPSHIFNFGVLRTLPSGSSFILRLKDLILILKWLSSATGVFLTYTALRQVLLDDLHIMLVLGSVGNVLGVSTNRGVELSVL